VAEGLFEQALEAVEHCVQCRRIACKAPIGKSLQNRLVSIGGTPELRNLLQAALYAQALGFAIFLNKLFFKLSY
jgi:hypothetical protein